MNLYISLFIIIIGFVLARFPETERNRRILFYIATVVLILQNALRPYLVEIEGNDTYNYYMWFRQMENISLWDTVKDFSLFSNGYAERDFGFPIFVKIVQLFTNSYRIFLLITATIIIVPIMKIAYKMTSSICALTTSLLIFESLFAPFFMTAIRQTLAMGIALFSIDFALERKNLKFLLFIFVAYTIHASAILFVPILMFPYIRNPKKLLLCMLALSPIIMLFAKQIVAFLGSGTIYEQYAVDSEHNLGTPVFTSLLFIIGLATYFSSDWIKCHCSTNSGRLLVLSVGTSVMLTPSSWVDSNFIRIVFYYAIFILPVVPMCIERFSMKDDKLRLLLYCCTDCVLLFLMAR